MSDELLPCPFCGELPVVDDDGDRVIIKCVADVCGVEPHTFAMPDYDEAAQSWNTRADSLSAGKRPAPRRKLGATVRRKNRPQARGR